MKFKQSGFSLVEAMVGLAIAGAIGLALMQQQDTASKMQSKNNVNQIINSTAQIIQTNLADRATCTVTLKGSGVGDSIDKITEGEANPMDFRDLWATARVVAKTDQLLDGDVKIESMKIINEEDVDYLAVYFDTDPLNRKKMVGGKRIGKWFRIQGKKDAAGKYEVCHSEDSNLVGLAQQEACQSMGAKWIPDPSGGVGGKCELINIPQCVMTETACRGVFSESRGTFSFENILTIRRECTTTYTRNGFPCTGNKVFMRECYCTGFNCTCSNGSVGCYSRTAHICLPANVSSLVSLNRCCQPATTSPQVPVPVRTDPADPAPIKPGPGGGGGGGGDTEMQAQ